MKVLEYKNGEVVKACKDEKLGRIMVQSSSFAIGNYGIINENKRIGFVTMPKTAIEALGLDKAGADFNAITTAVGMEPSRIIVLETTTQPHEKSQPKRYPDNHKTMAGEDILDVDGNNIYSETEVVALSSPKQDVKIMSANQARLIAEGAATATAEVVDAEDGLSVGE